MQPKVRGHTTSARASTSRSCLGCDAAVAGMASWVAWRRSDVHVGASEPAAFGKHAQSACTACTACTALGSTRHLGAQPSLARPNLTTKRGKLTRMTRTPGLTAAALRLAIASVAPSPQAVSAAHAQGVCPCPCLPCPCRERDSSQRDSSRPAGPPRPQALPPAAAHSPMAAPTEAGRQRSGSASWNGIWGWDLRWDPVGDEACRMVMARALGRMLRGSPNGSR